MNFERKRVNMKKVAIVTCYFNPNYGSVLQAYATQKILDEWNITCENICIDGLKKDINRSKTRFYLKQLNNPQIITGTILRIGKKVLYKKLMKNTLGKNLAIRYRNFQSFGKENFKLSKVYHSKAELTAGCSEYSDVLVGSDQLWLPSNIDADYYTLTWVPDNVNKIAYATSFGTNFLPKYQHEKTKQFLSRIDHVAVREQVGQKMIKEYAGLDVPVVCDPTLLFTVDDWMCIQKKEPIIKEKYIFCYFLGNNTEDRAFAKRLRATTSYKLVALLHLDEYIKADDNYADITPYDVGPGEMLNLIRNAEYIVTDSYHGSVFSILHRKTFFTSRRIKKEGILCTNNRLDSLFTMIGIEGRLIKGDEDVNECMSRTIDYDAVHVKLDVVREESRKYLIEALNISEERLL